VTVLVTLRFRLERCSGPLTLGDIAYTTTLLPGEKVRLFTSDRRTRFFYDSETKLSYRHLQASEEHFFMMNMARELTDLNVDEQGSATSHEWGDWHGSADSSYGTVVFAGGGQGSIEGGYDDRSTREFAQSLSRHAESSQFRSEMATRTASSVSVGEVTTRAHAEGEAEDHFESASRVFENRNQCHALSFFFHRISKVQTIRFRLIALERQVDDPAARTRVASNPLPPTTGVSVLPADIQATSTNRIEVEARAREAVAASVAAASLPLSWPEVRPLEPMPATIRAKALQQVDEGLVAVGLLSAVGEAVSPSAVQELSWERESCLPTAGIIVKGCVDECDVCEPELHKSIELELERKQLENELLKKQIDLLENSQEYRCCPDGEEVTAPSP
jgi:hypothetical protein